MRTRTKALVLTGILLVAVTIVLLSQDNGPRYHGRSLFGWLRIYHQSAADSEQPAQAKSAISHIGTNALPYALRWIQKENQGFWSDEDELTRGGMAVDIFYILGPAASNAIPELVKIIATNTVGSGLALYCLVGIGLPALPSLLSIASDTNATLRRFAIHRIEDFGTNAVPAVPLLITWLDDSNLEIAIAAFDVLIRLNLKPPSALPVFADKLNHWDMGMRFRAIKAISDYGAARRPVIDSLAQLLNDEDWRIRRRATNAIRYVAPEILP